MSLSPSVCSDESPPRVLARNTLASGLIEEGVRLAGGVEPLPSPLMSSTLFFLMDFDNF